MSFYYWLATLSKKSHEVANDVGNRLRCSCIVPTQFPDSNPKDPIALFYGYSAHHRTDMPKKKRSCVYFPRRKEGDGPGVPRHISVSYEAMEGLFHLPPKEAAREIGLCPTTFKKACRRFDLETWPFQNASSSLAGQRRVPIARREAQTDGVDAGKAAFSSAAPQGLLQQASMALGTRSHGEARHAGPAFQLKTFAPSYIDAFTQGRVVIGVPLPTPEGLPTTGACGMAQGGATEVGPPREKSCTEAVMEYLDLGCSISEADVTSMLSNDY